MFSKKISTIIGVTAVWQATVLLFWFSLLNFSIIMTVLRPKMFLVSGSSNLPLLAGILRTYQTSACDGENLRIECDSRTVVSIVVARYGQPVANIGQCSSMQHLKQSKPILVDGNEIDDNPIHENNRNNLQSATEMDKLNRSLSKQLASIWSDRACPDSYFLRYKFLMKIEQLCREQHDCGLMMNATSLGLEQDPCQQMVKFAEVAYKCRPNTFRNKIVCEGRKINLQCDIDDRIVILLASFGSTWKGDPQCPGTAISSLYTATTTANLAANVQAKKTNSSEPFDCQVSWATESAMSNCHGKRNCTIVADSNAFGQPNCPVRPGFFLKIVYTCISKKMIKNDLGFVEKEPASSTQSTNLILSMPNVTTTVSTSSQKPKLIEDGRSTTPITIRLITNQDPTDSLNVKESSIEGSSSMPKVNASIKSNSARNVINSSSSSSSSILDTNHLMMDSSLSSSGDKHHHHLRSKHQNVFYSSNKHFEKNGFDQHVNCTMLTRQMKVIGFVSDWISTITFIRRNQERFILYLLVSLFASLVCFLFILSARLWYQKGEVIRKVRQEQTLVAPFNFDDDDDDEDDDDEDEENGIFVQTTKLDNVGLSDRETLADTTKVSKIGLKDYKSEYGGYSTIRRPNSGTLMAAGGGGGNGISSLEPRPLLYSTLRKPMSSKMAPPYHHHHHHHHHPHQHHQTSPQHRASSGYRHRHHHSLSNSSSTMTTVLPKSILRDSSRGATPSTTTTTTASGGQHSSGSASNTTPNTMMVSTMVQTADSNVPDHRSSTLSFQSQKISIIDDLMMTPPPPPPPHPQMKFPVASEMIGAPITVITDNSSLQLANVSLLNTDLTKYPSNYSNQETYACRPQQPKPISSGLIQQTLSPSVENSSIINNQLVLQPVTEIETIVPENSSSPPPPPPPPKMLSKSLSNFFV